MYNEEKELILMKKLYKSRTDKKISGVCGGLAEYLNLDPSIVRLLMFLFIWCVGIGLIAYIAAALILPYKDEIQE